MRSRSCVTFNPGGSALATCSTASHAKGGRQNAVLHSVVKDCVNCSHRREGVLRTVPCCWELWAFFVLLSLKTTQLPNMTSSF